MHTGPPHAARDAYRPGRDPPRDANRGKRNRARRRRDGAYPATAPHGSRSEGRAGGRCTMSHRPDSSDDDPGGVDLPAMLAARPRDARRGRAHSTSQRTSGPIRRRLARADRPGGGIIPPGLHGDKPDRYLWGITRTYRTGSFPNTATPSTCPRRF
ncbi:hypothetical protein Val02_66480 [Virgisporangium aliadipatigenens]|uniref:Uncharacterized protein n=1 Tax=Virgisporangium aliadipatigenens TaxID=741659 RepID=A0A8J3YSN7_9ACTN|nr:hypothetical protein Val02_66480 [Virgisporangium aliadipatigenens]